jgi:hypothetical protein
VDCGATQLDSDDGVEGADSGLKRFKEAVLVREDAILPILDTKADTSVDILYRRLQPSVALRLKMRDERRRKLRSHRSDLFENMVQQSIIRVVIHGLVFEELEKKRGGRQNRRSKRRERTDWAVRGRTGKRGQLKSGQGTKPPGEIRFRQTRSQQEWQADHFAEEFVIQHVPKLALNEDAYLLMREVQYDSGSAEKNINVGTYVSESNVPEQKDRETVRPYSHWSDTP